MTGANRKKEVVNLALCKLVDSYKEKDIHKQEFIAAYIDNPIMIERFSPLQRKEVYER